MSNASADSLLDRIEQLNAIGVEFKGKNTIKVRYVLVYRGGKLVNETWQIDPKLAMGASY